MVPKLGGNDSGEIWCPSLRKNSTYQKDGNYNLILKIITVSHSLLTSTHIFQSLNVWIWLFQWATNFSVCSCVVFSVRRELIPPSSNLDTRNHGGSAFLRSVPSAVTVNGLRVGYYNQINSQMLQKMNLQTLFPSLGERKSIYLEIQEMPQWGYTAQCSHRRQIIWRLQYPLLFFFFSFLCAKPLVTTVRWIKSVSLKWLETGINWNCLCWEAGWDGIRARGKGGFGRASGCVFCMCVSLPGNQRHKQRCEIKAGKTPSCCCVPIKSFSC